MNYRKIRARRIRLLRANACSLPSLLEYFAIILIFGYLLFQIFVLKKHGIANEAETRQFGLIMTISSLLQSLAYILVAKRKKTVAGTGIRVVRGEEAVRFGMRTAFLFSSMALLILYFFLFQI